VYKAVIINRGNKRAILNENKVKSILEKFDYFVEIHDLANLAIIDQIYIIRTSALLVGYEIILLSPILRLGFFMTSFWW
jgi:hypothetical protein